MTSLAREDDLFAFAVGGMGQGKSVSVAMLAQWCAPDTRDSVPERSES